MTMNKTVAIRLPETTVRSIKKFICEREEGAFQKGMISDLVNKAIFRYICEEKAMRQPIERNRSPYQVWS